MLNIVHYNVYTLYVLQVYSRKSAAQRVLRVRVCAYTQVRPRLPARAFKSTAPTRHFLFIRPFCVYTLGFCVCVCVVGEGKKKGEEGSTAVNAVIPAPVSTVSRG